MSRRLAAVLTLSLLGAPAAYADAGSDWVGRCGFDSISQETVTGADRYVGILYGAVGVYSPNHGNVVNATVTCEVRVNDVVQASASRWGSGVVAVAGRIEYVVTDVDDVDFCTTVDYTSDDTPTSTECLGVYPTQVPPQASYDLLSYVNGWLTYADPTICPVLQQLAPGAPPAVTIDEQGDVYLADGLFWDCPPYVNGWPPPNEPPSLPPHQAPEPFVPTGGGYDTGDAGFLALAPGNGVTSACAFVKDPATGVITVAGVTTTVGTESPSIRCRLEDTATGGVLFDGTVAVSHGSEATVLDTVAANPGPVTVCTEGPGTGLHCRPGEPLDRVLS